MPASEKTVLFIDFDNTISLGDVLDSVIGKFYRTTQWARWQTEWRENRISTLDCLRLQVGDLEVDKDTLLEYVGHAAIDADFVHLQDWAASTGTEMVIVSDSFELILREILRRHGVVAPPIFANSLAFEGKRTIPAFPYRSPSCARCAHCKASHFVRYRRHRKLYVGDGLSDICPAMRADRVFAKDSLAAYLSTQGKSFTRFENLGDVVKCLWTDASGHDRAAQVLETSCDSDVPSAR